MRNGRRVRIGLAWAIAVLVAPRAAFGACNAGCILVNTNADTTNASCGEAGVGTCSLRDALSKPFHEIHFAIGSGHQTITLQSDLPDLLISYTIDGTTQPGYAGSPLIEITRGDAGTATHALRTNGLNGQLFAKGLIISHFNLSGGGCMYVCAGIVLADAGALNRHGGHTIQGCYIGVDSTGTTSTGYANTVGILDNSLGGNTIGGDQPGQGNVISGNAAGILLGKQGVGYSAGSVIQGNRIGTNAAGTAILPNGNAIWTGPPYPGFTPGILIGGSTPGAGNLIAGGFNTGGIEMELGTNDVIQGNKIGVDVTGLLNFGPDQGIVLAGETNATITNNVINVGSSDSGILLTQSPLVGGTATKGTVIRGNFIGTDVTGNKALPSNAYGISIRDNAHDNIIGGALAGQGNVIGGFQTGIRITHVSTGSPGTAGNVIQGNSIGVGVDGSTPIPNSTTGISLFSPDGQTTVGGENPGEGNFIVNTGTNVPNSLQPGISVLNGTGNKISGNWIYGNTGLGIDLGADGVTGNDPCDADTGPNKKQNFPVITAVTRGTSTRIQGTLNSEVNTTYRLEFFASATCSATGYGQGQQYIGYYDVTTSGCDATFDVTYLFSTLGGQAITATATDPSGNTSEFSACFVIPKTQAISLLVDSPADGVLSNGNEVLEPGESTLVTPTWKNVSGQPIALTGTASSFTGPPGAIYMLKDVAAGYGLVADGASSDCASATANCYEISVSNPAVRPALHWDTSLTETLSTGEPPRVRILHVGGSFTDVPTSNAFYQPIERILHYGVTSGCGGGRYCPDDVVFRLQMAVFLSRAQAGGDGNVPASGSAQGSPYDCKAGGISLFADVDPSNPFCRHAHYIFATGVTIGCVVNPTRMYCPNDNVSRGQMALFVGRAVAGSDAAVPMTYGPDPATGRSYSCDPGSPNLHFTDITTADVYCRHTHYLWAKGIISGFPDGSYQPFLFVSRGAMAKFLANGFGMKLYSP